MKTIQPIPPRAFDYYGPLLERYARRLIKDEVVASILAKQVLADQYLILLAVAIVTCWRWHLTVPLKNYPLLEKHPVCFQLIK